MKKDAGILYRSFTEAIELLPSEYQLDMYKAYTAYLMDGTEYDGDNAVVKAMLHLMKPSLDKASERYLNCVENGKKGGRPRKEEPNENQEKTKEEPRKNQKKNQSGNQEKTLEKEEEVEEEVDKKESPNGPKKKDFFFDGGEVDKAFSDYAAMRKKIKKPLTPRATELALKRLDDLARGDPKAMIAILEQSTFNGWQGLFSLKPSGGDPF